jgi:hypothetical protein
MQDEDMPTRLLLLVTLVVLVAVGPASAATRTETSTSGQVTATFSYDYKRTSFGSYDFSNLHVAIDRVGVRLVDQNVADVCDACEGWPADMASKETQSVLVRDLDTDGEPEVLVDLFSGGANCCWYSISYRFDEVQNKYISKVLRPGLSFPYTLRDIDRNGIPEFKSVDYRFAYKYGSNADTPRPLRIFNWGDGGKLVDVTVGFPRLAALDAADMYKGYLHFRKVKDTNVRGLLAAYLADSYNAGNGRTAWRRVVAAYRRGDVDRKFAGDAGPHGKAYLQSLRRFLKKLGYLRSK